MGHSFSCLLWSKNEDKKWNNSPNYFVNYKESLNIMSEQRLDSHILISGDHTESFIQRTPEIR